METIETELSRGSEHSRDASQVPDQSTRAEAELLLRTFLRPARGEDAAREDQIDAYRLLLTALRGRLGDFGFALALHAEWIKLSRGSLARGERGLEWRRGGEARSDASAATD